MSDVCVGVTECELDRETAGVDYVRDGLDERVFLDALAAGSLTVAEPRTVVV